MATAYRLVESSGLLGGDRILRQRFETPLDAHQAIVDGLPGGALTHLIDNVGVMRTPDGLEKAVGISLRTVQRRRKDAGDRPLSAEQGGRAWKFAELLAKATEVFGSQAAAEEWLEQPAMALDRRRPLDLLSSPAGVALVEQLLGRIEYGVYT